MYRQSEELRERWDTETTAFVLDSLLRARPTSPYGTFGGRVDLRGLVTEKSERVSINEKLAKIAKPYEFDRTKICNVDLSSSILHDWRVVDSKFEDCIFDNAILPGYRAYSAILNRCSFSATSLKDTVMGAKGKGRKTGTAYEDCDFSGADLREVSTEYGRFTRCSFVSSKWYQTQTLTAVFENCDFRDAEIKTVIFDGRRFDDRGLAGLSENKMAGCDFSTARIEDTSFLAIDFRNLIPPNNGRYVAIDDFPLKARVALDRLKANGSEGALALAFIFEGEFTAATVMPEGAVGILDFGILSEAQKRLLSAVFEVAQ